MRLDRRIYILATPLAGAPVTTPPRAVFGSSLTVVAGGPFSGVVGLTGTVTLTRQ